MQLIILDNQKETKKEFKSPILALSDNAFLMSQAIRVYLANQRQGTSKTKTRGEVCRTKKKWYKQKGTGGARHGARSANIFVGGGVVHGPDGNQNWSLRLNKKIRNKAFIDIFSRQAKENKIIICDQINDLDGKTKNAYSLFNKYLNSYKRVLIITDSHQELIIRSFNNIENALVKTAKDVSLLEISLASLIIMTTKSFDCLEVRLLKIAPLKVVVTAKKVIVPSLAKKKSVTIAKKKEENKTVKKNLVKKVVKKITKK